MAEVTYRVVVTREGPAWLADIPELPGTHTWAKNLPALDAATREVIALALDLPEGPDAEAALDLACEYHVGDPKLDDEAAGLRHAREDQDHRYRAVGGSQAAGHLQEGRSGREGGS